MRRRRPRNNRCPRSVLFHGPRIPPYLIGTAVAFVRSHTRATGRRRGTEEDSLHACLASLLRTESSQSRPPPAGCRGSRARAAGKPDRSSLTYTEPALGRRVAGSKSF